MLNLENEAKAQLFGLERGYVMPADVVTWADDVILALPAVPDELTQISLSHGESSILHERLHVLAGTFTPQPETNSTLKSMQEIFTKHPERAERIASALVHLFAGESESSPVASEAYHVDYSFELASSGAHGTYESAWLELRHYLERWTSLLPNPPQTNSA
jgi:hypothetical protein